jgi:hypothetical protein
LLDGVVFAIVNTNTKKTQQKCKTSIPKNGFLLEFILREAAEQE